MTSRFWVVCSLLYILILLGLFTLGGSIILMGLPLLLYLAAGILFSPGEIKLEVTRTLSADYISERKPITVILRIKNIGQDISEVLLEDILPTGITLIEGQTQRRLALAKGEIIEMSYTIQAGRGKYRFEGLRTTATDSFELFQTRSVIPTQGVLLVFPTIIKLHQFAIQPMQTRGFAGPIPARRGGSGINFFGIRQYQPGDPPRRINWRVSLRRSEELFTNEFEQEAIADVGIILDARSQTNEVHGNIFEYSVMAAAALVEILLKQGHRVSTLSYGFGIARVYPGYGKVQQHRIMRMLAQVQPGINYALESLRHLPTRLFPASSQLIILSPLGEDDREPLIRLRAQGYNVLVISPRIHPGEADLTPPFGDTVYRIVRVERQLLVNRLKRAGLEVVDWNINHPLETALSTFSVRMMQHRRGVEVFS